MAMKIGLCACRASLPAIRDIFSCLEEAFPKATVERIPIQFLTKSTEDVPNGERNTTKKTFRAAAAALQAAGADLGISIQLGIAANESIHFCASIEFAEGGGQREFGSSDHISVSPGVVKSLRYTGGSLQKTTLGIRGPEMDPIVYLSKGKHSLTGLVLSALETAIKEVHLQ